MEFKDMLRELREERGLSQMGLHDESGLGYHSIVAWERGKSKPSYDEFVAICRFFELPHPALQPANAGKRAYSRWKHHEVLDLREYELGMGCA